MKNQKGIAPIVIILIVVGFLVAVGGAYWFYPEITGISCKEGYKLSSWLDGPVHCILINKSSLMTWKTYRNEKYGFEFRYPNEWARNDWQVSGTTVLGTDFSSPDYKVRSEYRGGDFPQEIFEKGVQFAIYIDSFAAYSPYTFEELKSDRLKDSRVSKITEIEVTGERALYQVLGDYIPENAEVGVYFFSPRDNALLFTVYLKSTIEEKDSYFSVFNQILSTFKFISQ